MDVAKYIGLFLLKNQFCYVHGLGNLELKKKPATYNGEALQPAQYEVVLTPAGSIDDNLANFIATNEQISISKAANALRDFSTQAKADLHAGKEVPIPAIGKFLEHEGKIFFVTDPHMQYEPPALPSMRISRRAEVEAPTGSSYQPLQPGHRAQRGQHVQGSGVNWGRVVLAAVVLLVIVAIAVFGYRFLKNRDSAQEPPATAVATPIYKDTVVQQPKAVVPDTVGKKADSAAMAATGIKSFKVILNTYSNRAKAEKRVNQLKGYGHNSVDLLARDSNTFLVVMPVTTTNSDTTKVLDSLSRIFSPKTGVTVL